MTEREKLDKAADLTEAKTDEERRLLLACLLMAESKIINRMYPFDVPENVLKVPARYEGNQIQIAAYLYNKRGAEGETSRSENGVSRVFGGADVPEAMLRDITPMGMVLWMMGVAGNRRTFWYALFDHYEETMDEYGNANGVKPVYGKPVMRKANISAGGGRYAHAMFGDYEDYTHVIGPLPKSCELNESAILWIDTVPEIDADGQTSTPHNYVVMHIATSLTHKNCAVQQVNVSRWWHAEDNVPIENYRP